MVMIRISNIKLKLSHTNNDLLCAASKKLHIDKEKISGLTIVKQSLDARDKNNIYYTYSVDVETNIKDIKPSLLKSSDISLSPEKRYILPEHETHVFCKGRPLVAGSGPAGLFCAYLLSEYGYKPVLLERGEDVENRDKTIKDFWETGRLKPESNVQFGEGGAGTFSDGKLNTGINDKSGRVDLVKKIFIEHGAPPEIAYCNKPHLGTDNLKKIIASMRETIIKNGGTVLFNTAFKKFIIEGDVLKGIKAECGGTEFTINTDILVLAIGHSARDTFEYLINKTPLNITSKPFAVGVRIEHDREMINRSQYGEDYLLKFPEISDSNLYRAADYKLTYKTRQGNDIYSFCMCPGGFVVNSSSEEKRLCINGMSNYGRDSATSNSAIVMAVNPSDSPYLNILYQRRLEETAYNECGGRIVSQLFSDFEQNRLSKDFASITPSHKGLTGFGNINNILGKKICSEICEAVNSFSMRLKGFNAPDAVISAIEARTSSPLRILRDEKFESAIKGVFPCGEGAGYAGGITSAAVDGIKIFEEIYRRYIPF